MSLPEWRERAATLIEQRGWCRGRYIDAAGRCCTAGAVFQVFGIDPEHDTWPDRAMDAMAEVARDLPEPDKSRYEADDDSVNALAAWNDATGRELVEVLRLLRGRATAP